MAQAPPAAGAALPPPARQALPVLPLPANTPASYLDYLNDAQHDPYRDLPTGYTDIMDVFNIELNNANAITPLGVQNLVLSADGAMPLLLLHGGQIHTYLQPSLFRRRIGLPTTQWDDSLFVTKGNLVHNQPVTANWLTTYFHQVGQQLLAPTVLTIQTAFTADPLTQALGPYANGDAGTELIRVRRTCYCPAPYAALIIGNPVTPREAFTIIYSQIVIDQREAECHALIKILQAALLEGPNTGPSPLQLAIVPTAPLADALLMNHRNVTLFRDFPKLDHNLPRIQQNQTANRLGELVDDSRRNREEEKRLKALEKQKSPMDLVGATGVATLCRFVRVPDQLMLPTIYARLASASRHNRLAELQWAIDAEKTRLGYNRLEFIAVPSLLQLVTSVRWVMVHHSSLSSGLQPFIFGDTTPEEAQEMSSFYQLVLAGQAAPNLTDAARLLTPKKPNLPRHLFQTRQMLQRMEIMFCILLGINHAFTVNLTQFLKDFVDRQSTLFYYKPVSPGYTLCMPILVIQWITLRIDWWFRAQAVTDVAIPPPNLGELFTNMELGAHWEPVLSPTILSEFGPAPVMHHNFPLPAPAPEPRQAPPPPSGTPSGESSGAANPIPNRMTTNQEYKEDLFGVYKAMNLSHQRLRNSCAVRPPISPHSQTGGEMCLSWNVKGVCNLCCGRAYDHKPHTEANNQALLQWCQTHYHE